MRILLVEDDPTTTKSIEMMLSHANLNVYSTSLGEEGIDLAKLYDYDLILLDLGLPDMAGHDVLRQIRHGLAPRVVHVPLAHHQVLVRSAGRRASRLADPLVHLAHEQDVASRTAPDALGLDLLPLGGRLSDLGLVDRGRRRRVAGAAEVHDSIRFEIHLRQGLRRRKKKGDGDRAGVADGQVHDSEHRWSSRLARMVRIAEPSRCERSGLGGLLVWSW